MNKIIVFFFLLIIGIISCKTPKNEFDRLEIAKKYYQILDKSSISGLEALLTDSLLTIETEYDYEQTFSKKDYIEWLKWDAVFEPTYRILEIGKEDDLIKARISKTDKRILFLHQEPIITDQILSFEEDKISSIETTKYVVFNDSLFVANRDEFLDWLDKNHPEMNGFIFDQTENGGMKYLKAIQLYERNK